MKKRSSEIKKIRNLAANLGHKLGDFGISQSFTGGRIDNSKIPPETLAEISMHREENRITGINKLFEVDLPEDAILEEPRVKGVALAAKCEYCGLPVLIDDDFPSGAGPALDECCPGPANKE